jgi:hypothetical protein
MKAVDDQAAGVAKKKARVLAAAVGEAFYAVRHTLCLHFLLFEMLIFISAVT